MPSNKRMIAVHVTEAQRIAIQQAAKLAGLPVSEFMRQGAMLKARYVGVKVPQDMPEHGGDRTEKEQDQEVKSC